MIFEFVIIWVILMSPFIYISTHYEPKKNIVYEQTVQTTKQEQINDNGNKEVIKDGKQEEEKTGWKEEQEK